MNLSIRSRGTALTPPLLDHVERRMRFALSRFADRLDRIDVRVADQNGRRGGVDQRCSIHLHLDGSQRIVVEAVDADLFAAVDRAAARAGRSAARAIARGHELRS